MEKYIDNNKIKIFIREKLIENSSKAILLIHGFGEHGGRYEEFISVLNKEGYSSAFFTAPVPSYIQSSEENTIFNVIIDKDFYFDTIEFVVVNGKTTTVYKYTFSGYNSDVNVTFPADLDN